jgi:hypothetical protein
VCSQHNTPTSLPLGKWTQYSLNRRQDEHESRSKRTWEEKNHFPLCWVSNADISVCNLVDCLGQNLAIWKLNLNIMERKLTYVWLLTSYEEILQVSCSMSVWRCLVNQQMFQRYSGSFHIRCSTFRSGLSSGYAAAKLGITRSATCTNTRRQKLTVSKSMERYGHRSGAAGPVNSSGNTVSR